MAQEATVAKPGQRTTFACAFTALLVALAYAEMVRPVRESIQAEGVTFGTSILFTIFFLTAFRMFLGNTLHLECSEVARLQKGPWLFDFGAITLETTILIFLAGQCSVAASNATPVGFVALLVIMYVVDIWWVFGQWATEKLLGWERERIPWGWAVQNAVLVVAIVAPYFLVPGFEFYSDAALTWLGLIHVAAFINSVIAYDFYKLHPEE